MSEASLGGRAMGRGFRVAGGGDAGEGDVGARPGTMSPASKAPLLATCAALFLSKSWNSGIMTCEREHSRGQGMSTRAGSAQGTRHPLHAGATPVHAGCCPTKFSEQVMSRHGSNTGLVPASNTVQDNEVPVLVSSTCQQTQRCCAGMQECARLVDKEVSL